MKRFFFVITAVFSLAAAAAERKPMSLVIMFDGMRVDAPDNLNMINYQMLRNGKWHPDYKAVFADNCRTVFDAMPDSAPNHATIITGVSAAKHKVTFNGSTKKEKFAVWKPYLARLIDAKAITKGAFYYLWAENDRYPMGKDVICYRNRVNGLDFAAKDGDCVNRVVASLESDNTPESTLLFVDSLDHSGHRGGRMQYGARHGFYPYSRNYIYNAALCDYYLGNILHALRRRKNFDKEDWLIIVCSDHGGYGSGHGVAALEMARTTPLLAVSRRFEKGKLAKAPSALDIAPTVLAHHGVDVSKLGLDGKVLDHSIRKESARKLADGLVYYLSFDQSVTANAAGTAPVTLQSTAPKLVPGRFGKAASFSRVGGFLQLAKSNTLPYENGSCFTVSFWIRTAVRNSSDPVIFSNKDWKNGFNPGVAFIRKGQAIYDRKTKKPIGMEDFYMFNAGSSAAKKRRIDMRKMWNTDQWLFFAITRTADNTCYIAQGFPDGNLYWMTADCADLEFFNDLPWMINQDGTGKYSRRINFLLDDFAMWTRGMTLNEIKNIFIYGRSGASLDKMLKINK